jgi:hypothetical protein
MSDEEVRRIAQVYGVSAVDVHDAEEHARQAPLTRLGRILPRIIRAAMAIAEGQATAGTPTEGPHVRE